MLEEKDLQTIAQLMLQQKQEIIQEVDEKISASEQRMMKSLTAMVDEKISAAEERIARNTIAMMEAHFDPKFNLLAEGIQMLGEKLTVRKPLEDRVEALEAAVQVHSREIAHLKKAQ